MKTREKAIFTLGVLSLAVFFTTVAAAGPASSYEVSIYGGYPVTTWVSLALTLLFSILTVLASARLEDSTWLLGILTAISSYGVFFLLPALRGYAIYGSSRSDAFYHLGAAKDIISTGFSFDHLYYPLTHLLLSEISLATGLSVRVLASIVPFVFFLVLLLGIHLLTRSLYSPQAAKYCTAAAVPIVFLKYQVIVMPWLSGLALAPYIFWAALRLDQSSRDRHSIIHLLLLVGSTIYHPISTITVVGGLVTWRLVSGQLLRDYSVYKSTAEVVTVIIAYSWYFSFRSIELAATRMISAIFSPTPESVGYAQSAATSGYTLQQLTTRWLIGRWGVAVIFAVLGLIACFILIIRTYKGQGESVELLPATQYGYGLVVGAAIFLSGLIGTNPIRAMKIPILFSVLLVGYLLYQSDQGSESKSVGSTNWTRGFLITIVVVAAVLGTMTAYNKDRHVTDTTVQGVTWHHQYQNSSLLTRSQGIDHKLMNYIYGAKWVRSVPYSDRTFSVLSERKSLPQSLGYENHSHVSGLYPSGGGYLITRSQDTNRYQSLPQNKRATVPGYLPQHQELLSQDRSAGRVYSSGAYQAYRVKAD